MKASTHTKTRPSPCPPLDSRKRVSALFCVLELRTKLSAARTARLIIPAIKVNSPANHLILCNQQWSSADTRLITAAKMVPLCWDGGSALFRGSSCLLGD